MVAAPLAGALSLALLAGRAGKRLIGALACLAMLVSFVAAASSAWPLLVDAFPQFATGGPQLVVDHTVDGTPYLDERVYTWFSVGGFSVDATLRVDPLSALMVLVITGVGFLIHLYAAGYMADDRVTGASLPR